jgi:peptidoglycan/LPS O-acetylase OafA/YrhL
METTSLRKRYYLARFARIAPLYYLTLILGLIGLSFKGVDGYSSAHVVASVASKFMFLHSFLPNYVVEPAWAVATWTLSVEFVFYLFFPFAVSKVLRGSIKDAWLQLAGALLSCFVIVTLLKHFTEVRFGSKVYYFNPISYPGFFWAGMVTERLRREYSKYLSIRW